MSKPFITYTAQVEKLKNEKNLVITDDDFAVESLQNISYYALIGGYKHPFIDIHTRKYINEACFEDIVALYEFDEELRGIFFKYLCRVERKMRSSISYHFLFGATVQVGVHQCEGLFHAGDFAFGGNAFRTRGVRRFRQRLRHTDDRADCNAATNANTLDDHVNSFDLFPCFVVCVCCLLAKGTRAERVLVISAPALRVELPQ